MNILSIFLGILAIGLIALIHEVGHYFFAKRAGIGVPELSLGIGPKLLSFHRRETDYTIRLLPVMAYVRIEGEGEGALETAGVAQRFFLYLGGVVFNFLTAIGILFLLAVFSGVYGDKVIVGGVLESTPAVGILESGDVLQAVNGFQLKGPEDFSRIVSDSEGKPLKLEVLRDDKTLNLTLEPVFDVEEQRFLVGILYGKERLGVLEGAGFALDLSVHYVTGTVAMLADLISGQVRADENLVGVVGIVSISSQFTERASDYFSFVAIISLGMGVLNLLPIPALDGGKILLLGLEGIRKKRLSAKVEATITMVGFLLLVLLMIYTTINDIGNLLGG